MVEVYGAEESLLALAEELQAVYTSPHGHGAIDSRHYLAQNLMAQKRFGIVLMWFCL